MLASGEWRGDIPGVGSERGWRGRSSDRRGVVKFVTKGDREGRLMRGRGCTIKWVYIGRYSKGTSEIHFDVGGGEKAGRGA